MSGSVANLERRIGARYDVTLREAAPLPHEGKTLRRRLGTSAGAPRMKEKASSLTPAEYDPHALPAVMASMLVAALDDGLERTDLWLETDRFVSELTRLRRLDLEIQNVLPRSSRGAS